MSNEITVRAWVYEHFDVENLVGDEASIHCPLPGHTDKHASAAINIDKRAWKCLGCNKGGKLSDLAKELGLLDLPAYKGNGQGQKTYYDYTDEKGKLRYQVERIPKVGGGKDFYQRRPDGAGGWIYKKAMDGVERVPYRLPEVIEADTASQPIIIVEGEKCADMVAGLGFAVTTNSGGAGKWLPELDQYFTEDTPIYLIGDADAAGVDHMRKVGRALLKRGCLVYSIDLGYEVQENGGKDITNWLPGHSKEELSALIFAAPAFVPVTEPEEKQSENPLKIMTISDIMEAPPIEDLIGGLFFDRSFSILGGYPGCLKTFVLLSVAHSVASGFPLFGRFKVARKGAVLVVDEENSHSDLRDRLEKMRVAVDLPIYFLSFQGIKLDNPESYAQLVAKIREINPVLVIFDSLVRFHNQKENDASEMSNVMGKLREIVNAGFGVLAAVHHGKSQGALETRARGSSDIVGAVDVEYALYKAGDHVVLQSVKSRRAPIEPIGLRLQAKDGELFIECLGPAADCAVKSEAAQKKADIKEQLLAHLESTGPQAIGAILEWLDDNGMKRSQTTLLSYLRELVDARAVDRGEPGVNNELLYMVHGYSSTPIEPGLTDC